MTQPRDEKGRFSEVMMAGKIWELTDGTTGIATELARDARNIYRLDHRVIRHRMKRGLLSPDDVFAPRRNEHIRRRDAVNYQIGPPQGAVTTATSSRPRYIIITPPARRA